MPQTQLQINNLTPFASFIVAYADRSSRRGSNLANRIKNVIRNTGTWSSEIQLNPPNPGTFAFHLTEKRAPAWSGNQLEDELNHLVAIFVSGRFAAIYVSDSDLKSKVHDELLIGGITGWGPVDESVLVHAYISGESLRTLWLGGTHRRVSVKPDSKILSGDSLADAIDPLGDSTYVAGAVRSAKAGISLKRSGVWFGPCKNWNDFSAKAQALLRDLSSTQGNALHGSSLVHPSLARIVNSFSGVGPAYHAEWAAPETLNGAVRAKRLEALRSEYAIELSPIPSSPLSDVNLIVTHMPSSTPTTLTLKPAITSKRVIFTVQGNSARCQPWVEAVQGDAELLRIYYDSGHTIANATLTYASVQDRDFEFIFCDFAPGGFPYEIKKALNNISTNCSYEVIVIQPHVLQSKYIINGTQSASAGAKQLRSLLFGAQAMAHTASARFRVVADQR